jgi:hypothetical protein
MSRFATTAQTWPRAPDVQTFAVYAVMRVGPGVARSLFVAGTILVAVHVALLAFDPHALLLSNLLILMFDLLGLTVCLLGASSESPETRPLWLLFGCGLLLVVVGQLGRTYYDFAISIHTQTQANNSDFFFFAYGIPILPGHLLQKYRCWTEKLRMA